jgi:hypothetical protein
MAAAGGKVALTTTATPLDCGATATPCTLPDPRIIDLVSYGTSNNAEGGVTVNNGTALTNTQGSVRNGNGCTDTDNNNNDFTVVTNPFRAIRLLRPRLAAAARCAALCMTLPETAEPTGRRSGSEEQPARRSDGELSAIRRVPFRTAHLSASSITA